MTVFCIKNLGRLPVEVDVPLEELMQGMIAYSTAQERLEEEMRH